MTSHHFLKSTFTIIFAISHIQTHTSTTVSQKNVSEHFEKTKRGSSAQFYTSSSEKQRRSNDSKPTCSSNKIEFDYDDTFRCKYDNACFEMFNDCCPDYVKRCGNQTDKETAGGGLSFTCVKMGTSNGDRRLKGAEGVWMITVCPPTWPSEEIKQKCHNPPGMLTHPVENYLPVVGQNQFTYRNKHCAICNGINNYTTWNIQVSTSVIPPDKYDLDAKLEFIVKNGGEILDVYNHDQARRYCIGRNYKEKCHNVSHSLYTDCLQGEIQLVVNARAYHWLYYKNRACAICNGDMKTSSGWVIRHRPIDRPLDTFILFKIRYTQTSQLVTERCGPNTVYDKNLKFCRKGYITSINDNLSDTFLMVMWFTSSPIQYNISILRRPFRTALATTFYLMPDQISTLKFHKQDILWDKPLVATFHLTLTPYQASILANQHKGISRNISTESKKFLKLLNYTRDFTFHFGNLSRFVVIKMISKQLACVDGITFGHDEYKRNKTDDIIELKTGKSFSLKNYSLIERGGGNITLCHLLLPPDCPSGSSYVPLRHNEYIILSNLSLYHNITKRTFAFGNYYIKENLYNTNTDKNNSHKNDTHQNAITILLLPPNATVFLCLPYERSSNKFIPTHKENLPLYVLTLVGFSVSIISLLLLLITYVMFTELRTLPGKNLMNLSVSLLIYQCLWSIGTAYSQSTTWCTILAILEHYFILVSFLAMSVISYHSCLVFSQSFVVSKTEKGNWVFMKYSAVIWCCPAIFVSICVILDRTETFIVNYGTGWWLGTTSAIIYLFILPTALLLLFNIIAFILTAASLFRHQKQSQVLQSSKRQNLLICVKLSTLGGFPWIFAFLGAIFPDVVAFEYLFVIFACSQGLYIGVAFLYNAKTVKLYKNHWNQDKVEAYGGQRAFELQNFN